ncbi:MAG: hypothetical protein M3N93_06330 [Acidobacteriota bacterium]|nr:hypothetical protein [Acidobacteriota bacterium]
MPQGSGSSALGRRAFVMGWLPGLFHRKPTVELCGVEFRIVRYAHSPRRYLVIHGDEDTARDVLSTYMTDHDGEAYIVTGKTREVAIQRAKIDPNRMFSREGAERSLHKLNPDIDPAVTVAVLDFLDRERGKLLKRLIPRHGSRLFAMHNNRDYSVQDEIAASDRISIRQPSQPRNFFLCTDPGDFEVLKESPYNVVLQSRPDPDDGSLSRLAARRGFRYINLECAIGEYEAQIERVHWLDDRLP